MDDGHNCLDETKITRRASRVEQCNEKGRRYKFRRRKKRERERGEEKYCSAPSISAHGDHIAKKVGFIAIIGSANGRGRERVPV